MEQVVQPQVKQAIQEKVSLVKKLPGVNWKTNMLMILSSLVVVIGGVATGWFLAGRPSVAKSSPTQAPGVTSTEKEAGIADEKTFRDSAEGKLESGGINGEGTHRLVRDGGPSQNVYLTSTVIDLESFAGKNVKVWGETITAQKAGWLMDVGKVQVIE